MSARRARSIFVAGLLAAIVLTVGAPPATANLLTSEDATELAQLLADATEEQGVCYGWAADVYDENGLESSQEAGSSFGPDIPLDPESPDAADCLDLVTLTADITYTSETSEQEDSASIDISDLDDNISLQDVEALGYDAGDLLGEDDDKALFNLVAGLPLLAADAGIADPIAFEPPTDDEMKESSAEAPTNSPGSDWWRMYWWFPLLILVGIGALLYVVARAVSARRARIDDERSHDRHTPPQQRLR